MDKPKDTKDTKTAATDQDLLVAVAQATRLTSPAVKAILTERERAADEKTAAADAKEAAKSKKADHRHR